MSSFRHTIYKAYFRSAGLILVFFISTIQLKAQVPAPSWVAAFGSPGGSFEEGIGLVVGNDGNIYIGSRYNGAPQYGMPGHVVSPPNSGGNTWVSSAKLTNALWGTWAAEVSPPGFDYGGNIGIDNNLNTYTLGIVNSGSNGWFCTKTNTAGTNSWTFTVASSINNWNNPNGVCIDNAGNSYICGGYNPNMTVGGVGTLNYVGSGADGFVLQLNSLGVAQWAIPLHGAGCDVIAWSDALDYTGNLWVCGGYTGNPTFGAVTLPNAATNSLFVAEINTTNGTVMNVYTAANAGPGMQLCIDSCNNMYVAGGFQGTAQLGIFSVTSAGGTDAYLTKLLPNGNFQWVQTGGGAGNDIANGITIDKNWDISITGSFTSAANFGSSAITGAGATNTFIAKYASGDGAFMYAQPGGGSSQCGSYYIGTDANRQTYITGTFDNTATFGPFVFTGTGCVCSIYVAKIDSTPSMEIIPTPQATYCAGQCYTLPIKVIGTYTAGNIFTAQLSDATGSFTGGGTNLGTLTSNTSGIINICIPAATLGGTNYLLRVTSSAPNYCSIVRCTPITINAGPTITLSPPPSICSGGSAILTASGGVSYLWSTTATTSSITVSPLTPTTYTVGISNGICTKDTSILVTVYPNPSVSLTAPGTLCSGGAGTLTATPGGGTAPYTYTWSIVGASSSTVSINPSSTETYTVDVTDAHGCTASADVTVVVSSSTLSATISGNTTLCKGLTTNLCVNTTGGTGGNLYTWQPGGFTTPCITVTPSSTTTYTVSVVDNCGTTVTDSATVNVNPLPLVNFTSNFTQGCVPLCIQFYNTTTLPQGGPAEYEWSFGTGDSTHTKSPFYCYDTGGKYSVSLTVITDSGCSSTLSKSGVINAFSLPKAAFTISPQPTNILQPTIQFTNKTIDTYPVFSWVWTFGSGIDSVNTVENPSYTYQDTGNYCAKLIVTDIHGCEDSVTNCLVINPIFTLYIPSAFSPNGDGLNDFFAPKGQDIQSFEMYVFDRWGMMLCHTTDITKGWNGTVQGGSKIAEEDIYEYKIQVVDIQGNVHNYVGSITLVK